MNAYMGKILCVDLSTGKLWDEPLHEAMPALLWGVAGWLPVTFMTWWTAIQTRSARTTRWSS